jgi:chromosomal replication initiation ATPase DnaA
MACAKAAAPKLGALKRGARSNPERAVLCYLAREHGGLSLRDLAPRFGVDESTISQTASRVATWRASDHRWEQALRSIEDLLSPNR